MGPITADRRSGTLLLPFWKIPHTVTDDTGYFKTHHAQGGGFWLLRSHDEARTWEEPREIFPERNAEGWACWNNNSGHGIQLEEGNAAGRLVVPAFMFKPGEAGYVEGIRGGLMLSDE